MQPIDLTVSHRIYKGDPLHCPECSENLDSVTGSDKIPTDGSVSVCYYCGALLEFKQEVNDLKLVLLEDAILLSFPLEMQRQLVAMQLAIKSMRKPTSAINVLGEAGVRGASVLQEFVEAIASVSPFYGGEDQRCTGCGCTNDDCSKCIEETGTPCYWVEKNFCSRCFKEKYLKTNK